MVAQPKTNTPTLDAQRVDWTRRQLRKLVQEIVVLTKGELPSERFFPEFLGRATEVLAASAGAVWSISPAGKLLLAHQVEYPAASVGERRDDALRHERLLRHVVESGTPVAALPGSDLPGVPGAGNPTDKLLLAVPLRSDQQVEGVLELLLAPPRRGAAPGVQSDALRMAAHVAGLASEWLRRQGLRRLSDRARLWQQFDAFALAVHDELDVRQAAYCMANEGRRLIECDRVSVAVRRGRRTRIEAISGQDVFDPRSNVVRLQAQLAQHAIASNELIWFDGVEPEGAGALPPEIADDLAAYADETGARAIAVVPLRGAAHTSDAATVEVNLDGSASPAVGALILEQFAAELPRELLLARAEPVANHGGRALAAAIEHESVLWLPFWRALSRNRLTKRARYAAGWKWALGLLGCVAFMLAIVPAQFTVEGQGVLQPSGQRNVFAQLDGVVTAIYVEHGDFVEQGAVIAELRNTDLDVRIAEVLGQRRAAQEQLATAQRMRHDVKLAPEERDRLSGQAQQVEEQLRGLEAQYKLLVGKREQLVVRSPIAGRIITWNVRRQLLHRPVVTGQSLVTIADSKGPWELEIILPEERLGHLAAARTASETPLAVEYLLATDPTIRRQGTVRQVDASAQLHEPFGHGVRVLVDLDSSALNQPRSGATATARIDCGRRSLGYVWLHGMFEFVQSRVLFHLY